MAKEKEFKKSAKHKALSTSKEGGHKIANMLSYTKSHKGHFPFHEINSIEKKYPKEYEAFGKSKMKKEGRLFPMS